jgi:hypothetical protein
MTDCPSGESCQGGVCRPPGRICTVDADCGDFAMICDPSDGICVDCVTTAHCAPGSRCNADRVCQPVCTGDASCDDGLYCNGAERCAPADDRAGPNGCLATASPCIGKQTCDEMEDACTGECAAMLDADGDGHETAACGGDDCNDSDAAISPRSSEACNGVDDDCDAATDEDITLTCGVGACERTVPGCVGGEPGTCTPGTPGTEVCGNGVDDDCNGEVDEVGELDDFEGSSLGSHWRVAAGVAPAHTVASSVLTVTNAAFAATPSRPGYTWIYDPDVDLGNQLAWDQPIGTGDFSVAFDIAWSSTNANVTLVGIGVTSADDQLEIYAGLSDELETAAGQPFAAVRREGTDLAWRGAPSISASGAFVLRRNAGTVTISFDGATVITSSASTADLAHVVLFAVRHQTPITAFMFGEASFDRVVVCR